MRNVALLLLIVALAGCASVRKGLGAYQKAADKGIGFNLPPDAPVGPGSTAAIAATAPNKNALPSDLGGDKAHAAYTSTPQD